MTETRHLTRSTTNRVIAGVCAGLGEYFRIDPVIVRILFVAFVVWGGSGVLLYIILWLVIPEAGSESLSVEDRMKHAGHEMQDRANAFAAEIKTPSSQRVNAGAIVGIILILIGLSALGPTIFPWKIFRWDIFWPLIIILFGVLFIARRR